MISENKNISESKLVTDTIFRSVVLIFLFSVLLNQSLYAQIDFSSFSSRYSGEIFVTNGSLDFGDVWQDLGVGTIDINDAAVVEIVGVNYLDVYVQITLDGPLEITGCGVPAECSIPFTMEAAYSNTGELSEMAAKGNAFIIGTSTTTLTAEFPIVQRTMGPPGPPPTPVYDGLDLEVLKETAYLFIYGSVNVGSVDVGTYATSITVSVIYD